MVSGERSLQAPAEHFFISSNGGGTQGAALYLRFVDDMLPRSVPTAFESEHLSEPLNAEDRLSERY